MTRRRRKQNDAVFLRLLRFRTVYTSKTIFLLSEMVVTEIILAKVSRLCRLPSHSRGFLSRQLIFKSMGPSLWISLAHKTPWNKNASEGRF
jgi:hypothetical protein